MSSNPDQDDNPALTNHRIAAMEKELSEVKSTLATVARDVHAIKVTADTAAAYNKLLGESNAVSDLLREKRIVEIDARSKSSEQKLWAIAGGMGALMVLLNLFGPVLRKAMGIP